MAPIYSRIKTKFIEPFNDTMDVMKEVYNDPRVRASQHLPSMPQDQIAHGNPGYLKLGDPVEFDDLVKQYPWATDKLQKIRNNPGFSGFYKNPYVDDVIQTSVTPPQCKVCSLLC